MRINHNFLFIIVATLFFNQVIIGQNLTPGFQGKRTIISTGLTTLPFSNSFNYFGYYGEGAKLSKLDWNYKFYANPEFTLSKTVTIGLGFNIGFDNAASFGLTYIGDMAGQSIYETVRYEMNYTYSAFSLELKKFISNKNRGYTSIAPHGRYSFYGIKRSSLAMNNAKNSSGLFQNIEGSYNYFSAYLGYGRNWVINSKHLVFVKYSSGVILGNNVDTDFIGINEIARLEARNQTFLEITLGVGFLY